MPNPSNKEVKTPTPNPRHKLPEMLQDSQAGRGDTKAFQEATFISMLAAA
jgi:hypothetical protein